MLHSYDTTTFESLEKKIDEAKYKVASLETKNSKLVNDLNKYVILVKSMSIEIQKLDSNVLKRKAENEKSQSELSLLKKQKEIECLTISVSPRCELENLHNTRNEKLLKDIEKLKLIVKKFITSHHFQNDLLNDIDTYSHRQGFGF